MTRNNSGRSTTGGPKVPYCTGSPITESAKYLRLTVTRFMAGRATLADIEEALAILQQAVHTARKNDHL